MIMVAIFVIAIARCRENKRGCSAAPVHLRSISFAGTPSGVETVLPGRDGQIKYCWMTPDLTVLLKDVRQV